MNAADAEHILDDVDSEGLDYLFREGSSFTWIKDDPEFHRLRLAYIATANALENYIQGQADNE